MASPGSLASTLGWSQGPWILAGGPARSRPWGGNCLCLVDDCQQNHHDSPCFLGLWTKTAGTLANQKFWLCEHVFVFVQIPSGSPLQSQVCWRAVEAISQLYEFVPGDLSLVAWLRYITSWRGSSNLSILNNLDHTNSCHSSKYK